MGLPPIPHKFISSDSTIQSDVLLDNVVTIMSDFGYTIREMSEMPIPTFIMLCDVLRKRQEKEEKARSKAMRGKK